MVGVIETRCRYKRDGGTYACERERVGGGEGGIKATMDTERYGMVSLFMRIWDGIENSGEVELRTQQRLQLAKDVLPL
jgi:hypothetical protein